jgi:hypothetical protein
VPARPVRTRYTGHRHSRLDHASALANRNALTAASARATATTRWPAARSAPRPLPHLFRVLWLFWLQRALEGQAGSWVEQFRTAAGPLDVQARAELALVEAVIAVHTGDDTAALAIRRSPPAPGSPNGRR